MLASEARGYGLLSPERLRCARLLLQAEGALPGSMLGTSPFFTMRMYPELAAGFRRELEWRAAERERAQQLEYRRYEGMMCRMFHPVNGRDHFAPLAPPAVTVDLAQSLGAGLPLV